MLAVRKPIVRWGIGVFHPPVTTALSLLNQVPDRAAIAKALTVRPTRQNTSCNLGNALTVSRPLPLCQHALKD